MMEVWPPRPVSNGLSSKRFRGLATPSPDEDVAGLSNENMGVPCGPDGMSVPILGTKAGPAPWEGVVFVTNPLPVDGASKPIGVDTIPGRLTESNADEKWPNCERQEMSLAPVLLIPPDPIFWGLLLAL